jgi:hypothetical protein
MSSTAADIPPLCCLVTPNSTTANENIASRLGCSPGRRFISSLPCAGAGGSAPAVGTWSCSRFGSLGGKAQRRGVLSPQREAARLHGLLHPGQAACTRPSHGLRRRGPHELHRRHQLFLQDRHHTLHLDSRAVGTHTSPTGTHIHHPP